MRTIKGYDAVEIAKNHGVPLYDLFYRHEVSPTDARQFIDSRRDPQSFVLENWPDSEEEAEEVVLHRFHTALAKGQLHQARIIDVIAHPNGGVRIHPHAARLAAERLVEQGKLEQLTGEGEPVYRLIRNVRLSDAFFEGLDSLVCDECAKLNFDKPFHETCLTLIMEHFREQSEKVQDATMFAHTDASDTNGLSRFLRINGEIFSRGLDEAKSRFQSVMKTRMPRTKEEQTGESPASIFRASFNRTSEATAKPSNSSTNQPDDHTGVYADTDSMADSSLATTRQRITKQELIDYLKDVEIVDETGEVAELREREDILTTELKRREDMVHQLEKQRSYMEQQFDEMKRDMDTLLQAMHIAKKRGQVSENIIDVPMGE